MGNTDMHLNSAGTWMWRADLLQFWADLLDSRMYGGIFRYTSLLVPCLMVDVNSSLDAIHHITWECVANNTTSWINAQALFLTGKMDEYNHQKQCCASLSEQEKMTEDLHKQALQAKDKDNKGWAKAKANSECMLPEQS